MSVRELLGASSSLDEKLDVESVFSAYLYTGNGSTQTITNGIDLAGKGGLIWVKARGTADNHQLIDSVQSSGGNAYHLNSNTTDARLLRTNSITSFLSNGFSLGGSASVNDTNAPYASWTFRKAPKFFDVVTWAGDGTQPKVINHSLNQDVGMIVVKSTSAVDNWFVWHRSLPNSATGYVKLNTTDAHLVWSILFTATTTTFTIANNSANSNGNLRSSHIAFDKAC